MYLISSCLIGINCRYNGTSSLITELKKMVDEGKAIIACPEVLGGLDTPREPCEIQPSSNTIISASGQDYTDAFRQGAIETLHLCQQENITTAILKSRSPSCGCGKIYDGNFQGQLIDGNGLTADLLIQNDIKVYTEENYLENLSL